MARCCRCRSPHASMMYRGASCTEQLHDRRMAREDVTARVGRGVGSCDAALGAGGPKSDVIRGDGAKSLRALCGMRVEPTET